MFYDIPGMFYVSRSVWRHSPECLATFPGMFYSIPRNAWRHSPECLATFPGMFYNIPQNVLRHSPECLRTFPRHVWRHCPEYNIPPIPRIPFPVPVFLFLYITSKLHIIINSAQFKNCLGKKTTRSRQYISLISENYLLG